MTARTIQAAELMRELLFFKCGHPKTEANTVMNGYPRCRTCKNKLSAAYRVRAWPLRQQWVKNEMQWRATYRALYWNYRMKDLRARVERATHWRVT